MLTVDHLSLPNESRLAVVILRSGNNFHTGLVYRSNDHWRFLHLAWHYKLEDDNDLPSDGRFSTIAAIPDRLQMSIVAQCELSATYDRRGIPYGFASANSRIFRKSAHLCIERASGLTCATFVAAIFELAGFTMLKTDEWESREDDDAWKAWVIEMLKRYATIEHVNAVEADRSFPRVRPSDVVAAATQKSLPVSFAIASSVGAQIIVEVI